MLCVCACACVRVCRHGSRADLYRLLRNLQSLCFSGLAVGWPYRRSVGAGSDSSVYVSVCQCVSAVCAISTYRTSQACRRGDRIRIHHLIRGIESHQVLAKDSFSSAQALEDLIGELNIAMNERDQQMDSALLSVAQVMLTPRPCALMRLFLSPPPPPTNLRPTLTRVF